MERRRRSVFRLTVLICCAAWLSSSTAAQEILRYEDGTSSRQEHGQPGRKVTGEWSWVDATGRSHRIWYVADEFGFHAFGDTVPQINPEDQGPSADINVPQGSVRAQALGSAEPDSTAAILVSSPLGSANISTNAGGLKEINEEKARTNVRLDPNIAEPNSGQIDFASKKTSDSVEQRQGRVISNSASDMMSDGSLEQAIQKRLKSEAQSKNFNGNGFGKMLSGDVSRASHDLFHSELPNPIDGTDFVLIDRLQPPTIPKQRAPPTRITPVLVAISRPKDVISGVHTSSRSKSLSAMLPMSLRRGNAATRKSIVPQPLKVEGNLNLDNFFSPINEAKATPPPFQIGSLDDYYYYDYDYYDYADFSNNATTNATSSSGSSVLQGEGGTSSGLANSESSASGNVSTIPSFKASESTLHDSSSSRLPVPAKVTLAPETKFEEESTSSANRPQSDKSRKSTETSSAESLSKGSRERNSEEIKATEAEPVVRDKPTFRKFSFPPPLPPPPRIPASGSRRSSSAREKSDGDENSGSKEHPSSEDDLDDSKESTRERDD